MEAYGKLIDTPAVVNIAGQDIVIVHDFLNKPPKVDNSYSEVQPVDRENPAVYVIDEDIRRLRVQFGDIKLYGFWQIILESGLISKDYPLQIIYENRKTKTGFFVLLEDGVIQETGEVVGGTFISDQATALNIGDAVEIEVQSDVLIIPEMECMSAIEKYHLAGKKKKREIFAFTAAAILIIIAAFAVDIVLDYSFSYEKQQFNSLKSRKKELVDTVFQLKQSYIEVWPEQQEIIDKLILLSKIDSGYEVSKLNLSGGYVQALVHTNNLTPPDQLYSWLQSEQNPDGTWSVKWKITQHEN